MTAKLIRELGAGVGVALPEVRVTGEDPVLPSVFPLGTMAAASAGALTAAVAAYAARTGENGAEGPGGRQPSRGAHGDPDVTIDVRHAAVAFQSERHFRADGKAVDGWAALSGDYRTSDGWVRLHCNFDHHRDAALRALGLPPGSGSAAPCREDVGRACADRTAVEIEEAVIREGGCAAAMRSRAEWLAHPQARALADLPLVGVSRLPDGGGQASGDGLPAGTERPLGGVRVLDLTRVIAGPVAARALAAYGADVLRVGAAHLPEVPGLVVETAFGKRSCHIDLRSEADKLRELVRQADVVIQAYRPGALRARGFGRTISPPCGPASSASTSPRTARADRGPRGGGSTASSRWHAGSPTRTATAGGRAPCPRRLSTTAPATWPRSARSPRCSGGRPRAAPGTSRCRWRGPRRGSTISAGSTRRGCGSPGWRICWRRWTALSARSPM
nr:CoA transferase [Microbispora sp. GKU 823]